MLRTRAAFDVSTEDLSGAVAAGGLPGISENSPAGKGKGKRAKARAKPAAAIGLGPAGDGR